MPEIIFALNTDWSREYFPPSYIIKEWNVSMYTIKKITEEEMVTLVSGTKDELEKILRKYI